MSWVKIDDCAPEHRKILAAGAEAAWLWVCGLAYCNRQKRRDGFIPDAKVAILYPLKNTARLAAKLVDVGLWDRADDGYRIHDYHEFQPTADLRTARAEAGRLGGLRSGESRRHHRTEAIASTESKQVASIEEARRLNPDPDPDPVPEEDNPPKAPQAGGGPILSVQHPTTGRPTRRRSQQPAGPVEADVFEHWKSVRAARMKTNGATILTADRAAKIRARLAEGYSVADLKAAIDGVWLSEFHAENPAYTDIVTCLRDGAQVEKFRNMAAAAKPRDYGVAKSLVGDVDVPSLPQDAVQPEVDSLLVGVGSFMADAPKPRRTRGVAIGGQPAAENDSEGNVVPAMAIGGERTR